jgi:cytidylate kinase
VWLRDYQGVCHVQVIAPFELRVARVAEREKLSLAAARRRVRSSDQARTDYLARYHNANWLDPLLYHFIINTGQTPLEVAVALIVNAAQAMT